MRLSSATFYNITEKSSLSKRMSRQPEPFLVPAVCHFTIQVKHPYSSDPQLF